MQWGMGACMQWGICECVCNAMGYLSVYAMQWGMGVRTILVR